jgi:hypothetical protein
MKILLIAILFLTGCVDAGPAPEMDYAFQLKCSLVGQNFQRCENHEVVCYASKFASEGSPLCKFKQ